MSNGAVWFCCIFFAVGVHMATIYTPDAVDFILWRLSAILFLSAGIVSVDGLVGDVTTGVVQWTTEVVSRLSELAFGDYSAGAQISGVIFMVPAAAWVFGMLPQKWFRWKLVDKLAFAGPVLPSVVASCPGWPGDILRGIIGVCAEFGLTLVQAAIHQ